MVRLRVGGFRRQRRRLLDRGVVEPGALERGLGFLGLKVLWADRRQADSRRADFAVVHYEVHGDGDRREVPDLALQLQVGPTGHWLRGRDPDLAQDFGGFQGGAKRPAEEVTRFDRASALLRSED